MPHEDYADPIMNDRPRFHLDIPIRELTKHATQSIEASNVSSTPPIAETTDGVTHETRPTPHPCPKLGLATLSHLTPRSRLVLGSMPDTWVDDSILH